jgi:hypothetical protein
MSLEMYAFAIPQNDVCRSPVDVQLRLREGEPLLTIGHWEGLKPLHHWMHRLYRRRGGQRLSFNDTSVRLEPADLAALETAMAEQWIASRHGLRLGPADPLDANDLLSIQRFVKAARRSIAEEHAVIYAAFKPGMAQLNADGA